MVKRGKVKFCPRCGTPNNIEDAYCIKCGYSFKRRKKPSLKTFFIVIIILIIAWVALRMYLGKPIIPTELVSLVKNMTSSKTG